MPDTTTTATTATTAAPDYSQITVPLPVDGSATLSDIAVAVNGLKTACQGDVLTDADKSAIARITAFFGG